MRRFVTPVCILLLYTVGFDLTLLAQVRGLAPARAAAPARLGMPSLPSPAPVPPPAPAAEPSKPAALVATAARAMVAARFTARFDEDGRIGLRADCNSCGGAFRLDGESLSVTPLACTRAFCPSAPLDTLFVGILEGASSIDVEDGRLRVSSPRGSLTFVR